MVNWQSLASSWSLHLLDRVLVPLCQTLFLVFSSVQTHNSQRATTALATGDKSIARLYKGPNHSGYRASLEYP